MSARVRIADPDDPRLDEFRDLTTADRRPDRPGGRGLVIAEGVVVVRRMISSTYQVRALLGVRDRYEQLAGDLLQVGAPYYEVTAELMAGVVGFHLNRGVLATADHVAFPPVADLLSDVSAVALLEGIGDHENIGSIFRNAAALGVGAVLLGPGCADPLYRRSVRVSMGTVLLVPFARLSMSWAGAADLLRDSGFTIAALTPRSTAVRLTDAGLRSGRTAVLLGSEGPGLTEEALGIADLQVRIPMAPGVDSLNVATAGAIAFAEMSAGR